MVGLVGRVTPLRIRPARDRLVVIGRTYIVIGCRYVVISRTYVVIGTYRAAS